MITGKPDSEWLHTTGVRVATQRSAGRASGTQSLTAQTLILPVPPRRDEWSVGSFQLTVDS